MKNLYSLLLIGALGFITLSCVDNYQDANPPLLPDGPEIYVYPRNNAVASLRVNGSRYVYVAKGQVATFEVAVVDSPGGLDSLTYFLSDTVGSVTQNGFDALIGQSKGSFNILYQAEVDNPGSTFDDRDVTLSTIVRDKNLKETAPNQQVMRAVNCLPSQNVASWYKVSATGITHKAFADGSVDAGGTFSYSGDEVRLYISTAGVDAAAENAAVLAVSDPSFGLYKRLVGAPVWAPNARPFGRIEFCGSDIKTTDANGNDRLRGGFIALFTAPENGHQIRYEEGSIADNGVITIKYRGLVEPPTANPNNLLDVTVTLTPTL